MIHKQQIGLYGTNEPTVRREESRELRTIEHPFGDDEVYTATIVRYLCKNCGEQVDSDDKYCAKCGTELVFE